MSTLPVLDQTTDCSCDTCVNACKTRPGWFAPGEAAKAAELLGMTEQEFFNQFLSVDYWYDSPPIWIVTPSIVGAKTGWEYPDEGMLPKRGQCVFLDDSGKCCIHAAKPYECRKYQHDDDNNTIIDRHERVAKSWVGRHAEIFALLGREPSEGNCRVQD